MLSEKKRKDHAEEIEEYSDEHEPINFAWIILIGMKIGYSEKEISHMYFGKWCDMFEEWQKLHNLEMRRVIFEKKKRVSILDL